MKKHLKIAIQKIQILITVVTTIFSIYAASIAILLINDRLKMMLTIIPLIISFVLLVIIYVIELIKIIHLNKLTLTFGTSKVNIYYGDIFSNQNQGYKVIAFNENYDTITANDEHVIDKNSLHGIYLDKHYPTKNSRNEFHKRVLKKLSAYRIEDKDCDRKGYKETFELGAIFEDNDYLLLSFTKFDKENKAHVKYSEMITTFIKMWFNIDKIKGNKKVYLPLIGSGITRFDDGDVSDYDVLLSLIETFRISRVKFKYPANVNIILYEKNTKIDLSLLKARYELNKVKE